MIAHNPLHGSQRAGLPHWALASGDNAKSPQGIGMANAGRGQPAPKEPPHPLPGDTGSLAPSPKLGFHRAQLRLQPRPDRLPHHREPSVPLLPADMREAEEVERLRLPLL